MDLWLWGGRGKGWKEGIVREFGMDMCRLLYLKQITNKIPQYSTGNSAQCYVAVWVGREFGGGWIHVCVCMAESLLCSSETITTLFVNCLYSKTKF